MRRLHPPDQQRRANRPQKRHRLQPLRRRMFATLDDQLPPHRMTQRLQRVQFLIQMLGPPAQAAPAQLLQILLPMPASHRASFLGRPPPGRETPPSAAPSLASCLRSAGYSCAPPAAPAARSSPRGTPETASPPVTTPPASAHRWHRSCSPTSTAHSSADCTPPAWPHAAPAHRKATPNAFLPRRSHAAGLASHEYNPESQPPASPAPTASSAARSRPAPPPISCPGGHPSPHISHCSSGCSFRCALVVASHTNRSLPRKGRPFIMRAPNHSKRRWASVSARETRLLSRVQRSSGKRRT